MTGPALYEAEWPIDKVMVGRRYRTEVGNLTPLAESMRTLGLLHPVVVDHGGGLLAGFRRLEAARSLGWDRIAVRVAANVSDLTDALRVERDENTCRLDFAPSEAVLMARAIEELERPAAAERKAQAPGQPQGEKVSPAKLADETPEPRPRDVAAEATGYGRETLRKAGEVLDAERDPDPEVREAAAEARAEMDRTGKVNGAHRRVAQAREQAAAVRPERDDWTDEERALLDQLETGATVVVNQHRHGHVIAWAQAHGRYEPVDRGSRWGNPFVLGDDGDRATVIAAYAEHYLPHKPSLLGRITDLRGKALGCWCAPEPCHGDVLAEAAS